MKDEQEIFKQILEAKSPITGKELKSPFRTRGPSANAGPASDEERAKSRRIAQNPALGAQEPQEPIPDHIKALADKMEKDSKSTGDIGHIDRSDAVKDPSHPSNHIRKTNGKLNIKAIKAAGAERSKKGEPNPLLSTPEVKKKVVKKKVAKKKVVKRPRVKKA